MSKIYRCGNGMCGASDCSDCYPCNENENEYYEAKDAYDCDRGDAERDEAMFDEGEL